MPAPLLLVDDDLATIAQVKRLLAREGYEMVLATNAADAVIAWGHHLPPLVLISPKVESDRGRIVLEELRQHPDAQLLHVLLLGETIPGFGYPVAALPLDPETFAQTVNELVQGTSTAEGWEVRVAPGSRTDVLPAYVPSSEQAHEPDSWRATRKSPVPGRSEETQLFSTPDAGSPAVEPPADLESTLFGDLEAQVAREVEAEAMASVDANLARIPVDQELQDLEDDVRAEAARRREKRQAAANAPAVGLPTPDRQPPEDDFTAFDEPIVTPSEDEDATAARLLAESQKAKATLARAEQAAREAIEAAASEAQRKIDADVAIQLEREAAQRALSEAEAQIATERAERERAERDLHERGESSAGEARQLWTEVERLEAALTETHNALQEKLASGAALEAELATLKERTTASDTLEGELKERSAALESELAEAKERAAVAAALETELATLKERTTVSDTLEGELKERSAALESELATVKARAEAVELELAEAKQRAEAADVQLGQTRASAADALKEANARIEDLEAAVTATRTSQEQSAGAAEDLAIRLQQAREKSAEAETLLATVRAEAAATSERLEREKAERMVLEDERAQLEEQRATLDEKLSTLGTQTDELTTAAQRAAGDLREAIEEAEQSEARAQELQRETDKAQAEAAAAKAEADTQRQRSVDAEAGLAQMKAEVEKLREDFTSAHAAQRNLEEALEDAKASNLEVRTRADAAETKARVLEEKSVLPLKVPHRAPLSVTRFGQVDLGQLARLVGQIVLARAEIRLELAAQGGRRTVWLNRGTVTAAESTFGGESLLDRARRDGLIDARQTAELQMVRSATPAETVVVLKERGFLRDTEVVPLVQRYTEQVALDAFSESASEYRLTEEAPGNETMGATLPRPTLPLVAEALRRALPVEELLQRLGGSDAVPTTVDNELDLRALGFADKERRMLGYCDGEANVEDLALASGLKADVAFRALLVAKLLGFIELTVPARTAVVPAPQLDVKRLEAKFEQVQEADYFTMLGLGRAAGGDEVMRAWQRLAEEFDPIKYSGHPDTGLQQRAQVVYSVLEEAAKALGDDRRRAEYARHLVD